MLDLGFAQVAAVIIYAFAAGVLSRLVETFLKHKVFNGRTWAVWWAQALAKAVLVYVFWWLVTYGPVKLGA